MNDEVRYDFFGQEIRIGDTVIWGTTVGYARGFEYGVITKFSPKMTVVNNPTKKYSPTSQCYANQLCKVDPELVTMKLLKGN